MQTLSISSWRASLRSLAGVIVLIGCAGHISNAFSQTDIKDVFQSQLACALIEPLFADMRVDPVYAMQGAECVALIPQNTQAYFLDDSCQTPVTFAATEPVSYCQQLLDADSLGEGAGIVEPVWTLSPGSRLDVGARSLDRVQQPYMQRLIYRTVDTANGVCSLEMRVYSPTITAENDSADDTAKPSMLALHGGSWSARGFGFFGLELTIPHFVDQGFVVYAPFYRLLGDSEGSAACHNASIDQIADDASAALAWLSDNSASFGSAPVPVVFGQSAGAHLATSLSVNEPDAVAAAVLFYSPTDFSDFALRAQQGFYTNEQGLGILERVIDVSVERVDISASPVPENSFPQRIVEGGLTVPPMMMVHGMADDLVEARQSVRLCDALAGRNLLALDDELDAISVLRQSIACGDESELQLIREGGHALDVCLAGTLLPTELCPSGSEASREQVALAIGDAVDFALSQAQQATDSADSDLLEQPDGTGTGSGSDGDGVASPSEGGSGGGVISWLLALAVLLPQRLSQFRQRTH